MKLSDLNDDYLGRRVLVVANDTAEGPLVACMRGTLEKGPLLGEDRYLVKGAPLPGEHDGIEAPIFDTDDIFLDDQALEAVPA